jgi:predicted anti-sigma-YlaC factor YlaD
MSDAHAGDLLSALLDGELTAAEEQQVRAHLLICAECRRELGIVADVRRLVRELPAVEPAFGFFERMLRPANRWARAAVAVLAGGAAASVAVVALAAPREAPVAPHVARFVDAHTASASNVGDPVSEFTPEAVRVSFDR